MMSAECPKARILLVGTEHFVSRRDLYNPHLKDMLSPDNQKEILEVVERLSAFRPTVIGVEHGSERVPELNEEYQLYLRGAFDLPAEETYQVAFRIAEMAGLDRLHGINAWGREYEGTGYSDLDPYTKAHGQETELRSILEKARRVAERDLHLGGSLRKRLLAMNGREWLDSNLGFYMQLLRIGDEDEPIGADVVTGWWYNRNLRIFSRMQATSRDPSSRLLVLIGAGHVPILRLCVEASWDHELVEVSDYL